MQLQQAAPARKQPPAVVVVGTPKVSAREAAAIIGRSYITLQRWRKRGLYLAWSCVGGRFMYDVDDLYRFLEGERQEAKRP